MAVGTAVLILVALAGLPAGASSDVKRLRYDTAWSNGANWSRGRAPGADDVVVIGGSARGDAALALPKTARVRVRALLLARQGALLLPRDGALAALGSAADAARGATVNVFLRALALEWLDPESWAAGGGGGPAAAWERATPHAERVPCRHDRLQLPANVSFTLRLPPLPVTLAGVSVGARDLSPVGWRMLRARVGRHFLLVEGSPGHVVLRQDSCLDPAGCSCETSVLRATAVQDRVCAFQRPRCRRFGAPPCLAPVQPHGHCCPLCGAFLELRLERGRFRLATLREELRALTRRQPALSAHASRLGSGRVQVVVTERDAFQGDSVAAAFDLRDALIADAAMGVSAVTLSVSGPALAQATWGRVAAPALGTLAAAAAAIVAIFLVFSGWRSLIPIDANEGGSFVFARFENAEAESEVVEVTASSSGTSQAFDNPLYKQKDKETSKSTLQYSDLRDEELENFSDVHETDIS